MEARLSAPKNLVQIPPDLKKREQVRQKENLLLSRTRVLHDLETAQNPRYQEMLRVALADLENRLAKLN